MDLRAKCTNPKCDFPLAERSVRIVRLLDGSGMEDSLRCLTCGSLMTITKTKSARLRKHNRTLFRKRFKQPRSSSR
jgi:hypothetical protein